MSFTKVKNLKCERSQCHRRNARLYRAVFSLDLKVAMLTVISEVTVSESLFQTAGAAWQKAFLEKLRVAGLHWRMFAPRGLSCVGASYIRRQWNIFNTSKAKIIPLNAETWWDTCLCRWLEATVWLSDRTQRPSDGSVECLWHTVACWTENPAIQSCFMNKQISGKLQPIKYMWVHTEPK